MSKVRSARTAALAAVVLLVSAVSTLAASVTLTSVTGEFVNPRWNYGYQKKTNVAAGDVFVRDGLGSQIWWGNPTANWQRTTGLTSEEIAQKSQSGYVFTGITADSPFETDAERFTFGLAEHYNGAVWSNSATLHSVDFKLDIIGTIHGSPFDLSVILKLGHSETLNPAIVCQHGGPNPCGDQVSISNSFGTSSSVIFEGREYTLSLEGLVPGMDGDAITSFFTAEYGVSSAMLRARLDSSPVPPPVVPLPGAVWMLLAGVGGLAAVRRKQLSKS